MPVGPLVVVQRLVATAFEFDIGTAQPDALAVDAGEIGLAADAALIAAVERVVPDVQLPEDRRIDRRNEIAHVVNDVDDVFIGADAVEPRHFEVGQRCRPTLASPSRCARSRQCLLALCPISAPAGPNWAIPRSCVVPG